jgi:hypothetical protein
LITFSPRQKTDWGKKRTFFEIFFGGPFLTAFWQNLEPPEALDGSDASRVEKRAFARPNARLARSSSTKAVVKLRGGPKL